MSTLELVSIPFRLKQFNSSVQLGVPYNTGVWTLVWWCCCGLGHPGIYGCSCGSTSWRNLSYKRMRFVLTRTFCEKNADAKLIISNPDVFGLERLECNFQFDKGRKAKACIFTIGNCKQTRVPPTLYGTVNIDLREEFDTQIKDEVPVSISLPEDNKSKTSAQLLKTSAQLVQNFTTLLEADPEGLSDAVLRCSGVEIPVHKCILAARSPVFAAMFRNKMAEAQNNAADIVDVEPDILRVMLKYIYCGQVDGIPDGVEIDLLYAADKYRLEDLKQFCIGKMRSTMSVKNVFDVLVCGELHGECLKAYAKEFICKQREFSKLEDMEQWKLLVKDRPGLAIEVLMSVVKHQEGAKK